jgi:hypothetical protein
MLTRGFVALFTLLQAASFNKPTLVTEFGCNDLKGQYLTRAGVHAGIWAPWFAGAAGAGAGWWGSAQRYGGNRRLYA